MDWQQQLTEGQSLFEQSRYFDSEQLLTKAIEHTDFVSLPESDQAQFFLECGRALKKLAKFEQCGMYLSKARDIFKTADGTETYNYSEAVHELAQLSYEQGDLTRAQELLQEALVIRKAIYDEPHKDIAKVLHHIGEVAWKQGDQKLALQNLDLALEMQKQCVGELHEDYADTLGDRSLVLAKLGRLQEAEAGLRRGLEIRKACLPPDHAMIGNSLVNLAYVLRAQQRSEHVEEMNRQAIDIAVKSYGEYSPRTATCINNLGGYFLSQGNLHEAANHFERALAIKEAVLGKDNPDLVTILGNVAVVYAQLKRTKEAEALRERAVAITKAKILGSNQKDIDTMIQLAEKLKVSKKNDEAREVLAKALEVANAEHGPDSLKAAQVLLHLGMHVAPDDQAKAQDYMIKVLRIKKKHLGKKHPEVAIVLRALGNNLAAQGIRDVAELLSLQAQLIEHASGVEDPVTAGLRRKLNETRDAYGPTDPRVASQMKLLGELYWNRGQKKESNELFAEYISLKEKQVGVDNQALAQELMLKSMKIMPTHGWIALEKPKANDLEPEDMKLVIDLLERAVQIDRKNAESNEDQDAASSRTWHLIAAYAMNNELEKAEALARESVAMKEKASGSDHWSLAVPLLHLERVLKWQDKEAVAKEVEQRRAALPQPTRAEKEERSKQISERLAKSMNSILMGLVGAMGNEETDTASGAEGSTGASTAPGASTAASAAANLDQSVASDGALAGLSLSDRLRRRIEEEAEARRSKADSSPYKEEQE